jgi:TIM-barrel protein
MVSEGFRDVRLAAASLSGQSDAAWARTAAKFADLAFLGGIALDGPTRAAARRMVDRDRDEFLPPDPIEFIDDQLAVLADVPIRPGFNVRTTELEALCEAAVACRERDAILEINAHCRQEEMCAAGTGETLLHDADRLCEQVRAASETGATVSVKVRAELSGVDLAGIAHRIERAGADAIHVDAMDSESVVANVASAADLFVIANNGVRDAASVREYFEYGADAVSVGRPSDDPRVLARVHEAVDAEAAPPAER